MGAAASGARDANAFHAAVREMGGMPAPSTLTYQGVFNQHTYCVGCPESSNLLSVAVRAASVPAMKIPNRVDSGSDETWVGCFLKSCKDGQPRDATPIDMVVVLDVSGSMSEPVTRAGDTSNRLTLAKNALSSLLRKLRSGDRFGLATFTRQGSVVQQLVRIELLDVEDLTAKIEALRAGGGTTLSAGMEAAMGICEGADELKGCRHKRLLFLTDMDDVNPSRLNGMIAEQATRGLFVTFVGIGQEFNAALAEVVSKHPGANYFCITRNEDLQRVIVDHFDWNFFPACFDVELSQQFGGGDLELESTYGTPFDTREEPIFTPWYPETHRFYPALFRSQACTFLLCAKRILSAPLAFPVLQCVFTFLAPCTRTIVKVDTVFPTAVAEEGAVEGGLILLKLRGSLRTSGVAAATLRLTLRYSASLGGAIVSECKDLQLPVAELAMPDPVMEKGILLQRYVEACREYLLGAELSGEQQVTACHLASLRLNALLADFSERPGVDAQLPGVRQELQSFCELVERHLAAVDEAARARAAVAKA